MRTFQASDVEAIDAFQEMMDRKDVEDFKFRVTALWNRWSCQRGGTDTVSKITK